MSAGYRFEFLTRLNGTLWYAEVFVNLERLAAAMPDAKIRDLSGTGPGRWLNEILESVKVAANEDVAVPPEVKCEQYLLHVLPLEELPDMDHDLEGNPVLKPHWFAVCECGKFDVILQTRRVRIRPSEIRPGKN